MQIVPFEPQHLSGAADLFCRVFRTKRPANPNAVAHHLRDVYLANPWHNPDDPSLVCEVDGRVAGFLGVIPFPLDLRGRPVTAAIGGNFMVDPTVKIPFAGPRLMKRFLAGPHDVSMTDTSNESGRNVWESLGGRTLHLESLQWIRVLRPAGFALSIASRIKPVRPLTWLGRPLASLADALLAKPRSSPFRFVEPSPKTAAAGFEARELTPEILIEGLRGLEKAQSLLPAYTPESLAWLLGMARQKREFGGRLIGRALYQGGTPVGWYLYYPNPGRWGQVLQAMARPSHVRPMLEHLFADAHREGSTALVGRAHPLLLRELPSLRCFFMNRTTWVQVQTRNQEVLDAVSQGQALLTRLEGEWWTRFQNDAFDEAAAPPEQSLSSESPVEPREAVSV